MASASNDNSFTLDNSAEYVDIHGNNIKVVLDYKTAEILVPLSELKKSGFRIYEKSQYHKLLISKSMLEQDLENIMLTAAQDHMLKHENYFSPEDVIESIKRAKKLLTEPNKQSAGSDFVKTRLFASDSSNIKVISTNTNKPVSPVPPSNVHVPLPKTPKTSPTVRLSEESVIEMRQGSSIYSSPEKTSLPHIDDRYGTQLPRIPNEILELDKEYHVEVSYVQNPHSIWVRRKNCLLDEIFSKIQASHHEQTIVQTQLFNTIYIACDEDNNWLRCKLIKVKGRLRFSFLDYGNTEEVPSYKVKTVPNELASIPALAVRVHLPDSTDYNPEEGDYLIIVPTRRVSENGSYMANLVQVVGREDTESSIVENNPQKFFETPKCISSVQHDQRVTIIGEEDGKLILRTKECFMKEHEIDDLIQEYIGRGPNPLTTAENGQLVLAPKDGRFHRAQIYILNKSGTMATVRFLDFPETGTMSIKELRNVTKRLSQEPVTYFLSGPLRGFDNETLMGAKAKKFILSCIDKRTKFTVVLEDFFDLITKDNESLSKILKMNNENEKESQCKSPQPENKVLIPKKLFVQNMDVYKAQTGFTSCMCTYIEDIIDSVYLTDMKYLDEDSAHKIMKDHLPNVSYTPSLNEVCFGYYEGDDSEETNWYRCVIKKEINGYFEVLFIDFGNKDLLKTNKLREITDDARDIPCLAIPCRLINLPSHPEIRDILGKHLRLFDILKIDVKNFSDGKYNVEIPSVYKEVKQHLK